jgi:hypothetical protein
MPIPMTNASEPVAPLRAHLLKGTVWCWLLLPTATMAKYLQICQQERHWSKFVTQRL